MSESPKARPWQDLSSEFRYEWATSMINRGLGLRIEFQPSRDPKVFVHATGEEVTRRVARITIFPGPEVIATLHLLRGSHPYVDPITGNVATEDIPVVQIVGEWEHYTVRTVAEEVAERGDGGPDD